MLSLPHSTQQPPSYPLHTPTSAMKRSSPSSTSAAATAPAKKPRSSHPIANPLALNMAMHPAPHSSSHFNHMYMYPEAHYLNQNQMPPSYNPGMNRTIFFGSVNPSISLEAVLDQITTGPIESARLVPEKNCAFVTFLNPQDASAFLSLFPTFTVPVGPSILTLNWGKRDQDPLPVQVQTAVNAGATRNVYIAGVSPSTSLTELFTDVEMYGSIDQIRIIPPRENHTNAIAFIHFASIHSAINCVHNLTVTNPKYAGRRISYGKDRCAPNGINSSHAMTGGHDKNNHNPARFHHQPYDNHAHPGGMIPTPFNYHYPPSIARTGMADPNAQHPYHPNPGPINPNAVSISLANSNLSGSIWPEDPTLCISGNLSFLPADVHTRDNPQNLRVLYFGNLPSDAIPEDICNVVRAGLIDRVHMTIREDGKRIIFVSFIDPRATSLMYYMAQTHGVVIRSRRIRVHWGKHTAGVHPTIASSVLSSNATRCVYVGGLASVCRSLICSQADPSAAEHTDPAYAMETNTDSAPNPSSSPNSATGTPSHLLPVLAEQLREVLGEYGDIEVIYAPVDKPIAFVHFMELRSAVRAVSEAAAQLRNRFQGTNLRIGYARDRCADPIKMPQPGVSIGGAIPRRATGSFDPINPKSSTIRSTAADNSIVQADVSNLHVGDSVTGLPPKPGHLPGLGDISPTNMERLSDNGHDDDPAAGVREEMLGDD